VAVELRQRQGSNALSPADVTQVAGAMDALDETIHQKVRLGIMSTLMALGEADFKLLKETLALSDGNLSTHLALLEDRGYVAVKKEFRGKRPHTSAEPTEAGRRAFADYLAALERIIRTAQP
jgi:DNA-binding HxlR family transcriptional regulator